MNKMSIAATALALGLLLGYGASQLNDADPAAADAPETGEPLYWVAPMDPSYRRDQPGKSPMGMDLIPVYADSAGDSADSDPSLVRIAPEVVNNLGITTAAVSFEPLPESLETVGYVQFDENRLQHVHTRVDGWVEKLHVSAVGDRVKAGQVLFEVYSPMLLSAQDELLAALRSASQNLIRASRQRLELLGMSGRALAELERSGKAQERIRYYAEHDGVVSALAVRQGMYIKPATEVMAIGQLDQVWMIAEVFQRQAARLALGQTVTIAVDSYPGEQWQGVVDYIYPVLNAQSRTLQLRVQVDNRDYRLKPNMYSRLSIHTGDDRAQLSIPRTALIRGARYDRAVLALGEGRFRTVKVQSGREAGDRVVILAGLTAGDQVVSSGQFLIDSESNIAMESARLGEQSDSAASAPPAEVLARGVIVALLPERAALLIAHEPIPEWQWPAMEMEFALPPQQSMDGLQAGDSVQFSLTLDAQNNYHMIAIEQLGSAAPADKPQSMPAGHDHQHDHDQMHGVEHKP